MIFSGGIYTGTTYHIFSSHPFTTNGTVTLELNMNERVLFFWVNGVLVPHVIINIPVGVYFGVCFICYISILI
jgi:hypothetical protein